MREDDKESRRFFRTRLWLDTLRCIELFGQETVSRRAFSVQWILPLLLTSLASNGAVHVRGGVIKSTLVFDTRCTYEHSRFQSLSPDQVQYLSLSSDTDAHSVNGSRNRFMSYDTQSFSFISSARMKLSVFVRCIMAQCGIWHRMDKRIVAVQNGEQTERDDIAKLRRFTMRKNALCK